VTIAFAALLCLCGSASAGDKDSLQIFFHRILQQNQQHLLPDSLYLKKVDSIVFHCFDRADFPQLLEPYRRFVFSDTAFRERRIIYFQYRGIHSVNNNSTGQSIFWFGKMAEEAKSQKNIARQLAANRAMISIFADNNDYEKCFQRYDSISTLLTTQANAAAAGKSKGIMMENVCGILGTMTNLFYSRERFTQAHAAESLLLRVMGAVNSHPQNYEPFVSKIRISANEAAFAKARYEKDDPELAASILNQTLHWIRSSTSMSAGIKPFFEYDAYKTGIEYFMETAQEDSASKYLSLLDQLNLPMIRARKQQFYHEQMAMLLHNKGQVAAAYEHNRKALALKDSVLRATLVDRDNNVYAQTQIEFSREQLSEEQQARSKAEQTNISLLLLIISILIIFTVLFFWLRQRQKNKFLHAKLRMARNIHDEIGPQLLYIKLLTRKEKESGAAASPHLLQMDGAIGTVMETVRGLAHDLKSEKELSTIQLYEDVRALLHKTEALTGINYQFYFNQKDRPLNYFQYQHLRNILSELVNNTLKHAEWSRIDAMLLILPRKIQIVYTDNGQGFEPAYEQKNGIGLANIRERVDKLRGELSLRNNYPEGYTIEINIPFS
jgi:signal transduction histidine kinase